VARIFVEHRELGDDPHEWLELLGVDEPPGAVQSECVPPLDVFETAGAVEILMDLPGIASDAIRVVVVRDTVVVAGRKPAAVCEHKPAGFHLAERAFGRFARAVRLTGAFDAGRASAALSRGELRIVLPRIDERRGREIRVPITAA
jgi:HSP20 family protein